MATTRSRPIEPSSRAQTPKPIDTTNWPPMSDDVKAAWVRMASEPDLFDTFDEDTWVVFSGAEIVAAGPDYDEVIRTAEAAGKPATLIVPIMPDNWV